MYSLAPVLTLSLLVKKWKLSDNITLRKWKLAYADFQIVCLTFFMCHNELKVTVKLNHDTKKTPINIVYQVLKNV